MKRRFILYRRKLGGTFYVEDTERRGCVACYRFEFAITAVACLAEGQCFPVAGKVCGWCAVVAGSGSIYQPLKSVGWNRLRFAKAKRRMASEFSVSESG